MRKGLERIRTLSSTKQRSIPLKQRSPYIELYLLSKERERFMSEASRLERGIYTTQQRLNSIEDQMQKLKEVLSAKEEKIEKVQDRRKEQWKTLDLPY